MDKFKGLSIRNSKVKDIIALTLLIAAFIGIFLFWGDKKTVEFCDEVYTYILSNSDNEFIAFQLEGGRWYENGETAHIISADNGFTFGQVMLNNKGDVHPPMYYFVVHFLSVLKSGSYSKWIGLVANAIFSIITLVVLYLLIKSFTGSSLIAGLASLAYALCPAVISSEMLLRMYNMFAMWVIIFIYISYRIFKGKRNLLTYGALAATTFFGFLTQYYFAVFCVLFTCFYCVYELVHKNWKYVVCYVGSLCVAVVAATVFWRTWIRHMFSGYLGDSVMDSAFNFSNIFSSIKYGCIHLFTMMFNKIGMIIAIILIVGIIVMIIKKDSRLKYVVILAVTAVLYSIAIVHLTPAHLLSYRYFYPVTGLCYLAVILTVFFVVSDIVPSKAYIVNVILAAVFVIIFAVIPVLDKDSVLFVDTKGVYNREMAILEENKELPWIYFGYENSTMSELLYDSAMSSKFMMVNNDCPFTDKDYTDKDCEFLLFVQGQSQFEEDAYARFSEWFKGNLEYEEITGKGYMTVYKVTHTIK